jgi:hypothetical protein
MHHMSSPFVYEEPVGGDDLVDRGRELALLVDRMRDGRNSRVEGPRRFGKTSLLRAALGQADKDGMVAIEVNFLGCVTAADVAERIERAYSRQLDSRLRKWFAGVVRTWRPTLSAAPGGVGVGVSPRVAAGGLLDRLALPKQVLERSGRVCVVAFDEFQEVVRISDALAGVFRSELETHGDAASYVFSGSHPGLMRDLFSDRRHAFFAQAAPVELAALPADELADHIGERFAQGRRDPGEALGPLLDTCEGHPQRAMLLAHHLYQLTPPGAVAGPETWVDAQDAARLEAQGEIQVLWMNATKVQRRVLKAIADGQVKLGSKDAVERYDLIRGSTTTAAVEALVAAGHVVDDAGTASGHRLVDPFVGAWLRQG